MDFVVGEQLRGCGLDWKCSTDGEDERVPHMKDVHIGSIVCMERLSDRTIPVHGGKVGYCAHTDQSLRYSKSVDSGNELSHGERCLRSNREASVLHCERMYAYVPGTSPTFVRATSITFAPPIMPFHSTSTLTSPPPRKRLRIDPKPALAPTRPKPRASSASARSHVSTPTPTPAVSRNRHWVFAYGTMKRGSSNAGLLAGATYLGEFRTITAYPLVVGTSRRICLLYSYIRNTNIEFQRRRLFQPIST